MMRFHKQEQLSQGNRCVSSNNKWPLLTALQNQKGDNDPKTALPPRLVHLGSPLVLTPVLSSLQIEAGVSAWNMPLESVPSNVTMLTQSPFEFTNSLIGVLGWVANPVLRFPELVFLPQSTRNPLLCQISDAGSPPRPEVNCCSVWSL